MTTIELPDDLAAALTAAAKARRRTVPELIADMVAEAEPDELDAFIGVGASGHLEAFDIHAERGALAAGRDASTI